MAYRAFYAMPALNAGDGVATQALFGFIRLSRQTVDQWKPTHLAAVFDGGLPESRLKLCPEYKAQRAPMPDELRSQLPLMNDYLDCAHIARLRVDGQEADDVMATLAVRARDRGFNVLLATSDKDMYQLVDERVALVLPARKQERFGPEAVAAKTGVPPTRIVDWLALVGDHADNIPGVPGVGPKTAAQLIALADSLEDLWAEPERIRQPALREKITGARALVERNRAMVRLNTQLEGLPSLDDLTAQPEDLDRLDAFLERFDLHSLKRASRPPSHAPEPAKPSTQMAFDF